ncbi:hypothetical protein HMPREF9120_01914 [Neisseria sp. oral taxon 020 str. F0370]|uniref:hypothetical protein n=1 Tax=unclassified Neisseria TaxID=2623750 RepID=UPI0002A1D76E|nr:MULTISPECIES: hypothetical protein [unclassified Neisseria]EKY05325.1 hypothetical protein HMPREF9120_01914 [Neisseria sp. oral taxon 020 str. F0370]
MGNGLVGCVFVFIFAVADGVADDLDGLQQNAACRIETDAVACLEAAALDDDVAAGFQAALPALAVVLVLLFAGGFKAETGFGRQQDGILLSVVAFETSATKSMLWKQDYVPLYLYLQ